MKKTIHNIKVKRVAALLFGLSAFALSTGTAFAQEGVEATSNVVSDPLLVLSAHIESVDDLSVYTSAVIEQDKNASAVGVSGQSTSLTYKQPVKLLAFIPLIVPTKATVLADGTVDLSYPWYAIFSTKNNARLRANLEVFAGRIAQDEDLSSLEVQARVVAALRIVMKDNLEGRDTMAETE